MGMTPKMISVESIIAKVSSDFDIGGTSWLPYIYEWIGQALQQIGGTPHLQRVKNTVMIKNHKVPMPCDLVHLRVIDYKGKQMLQGTTKRHMTFKTPSNLSSSLFNGEYPVLDTVEDDNGNILQTVASTYETKNVNTSYGEYYYLTPDTIVFSITDEEVTLHYDAFALDERGFPLIPDSFQHQEAITFYILYKYLSRGNTHPSWNMMMAKQEWEKLAHQAYNRGAALTLADAQNFTNQWSRIVFDHFSVEKFGEDMGNKQFNYNI